MFFLKEIVATAMVIVSPFVSTFTSSMGFYWDYQSPETSKTTPKKTTTKKTTATTKKTTKKTTSSSPKKTSTSKTTTSPEKTTPKVTTSVPEKTSVTDKPTTTETTPTTTSEETTPKTTVTTPEKTTPKPTTTTPDKTTPTTSKPTPVETTVLPVPPIKSTFFAKHTSPKGTTSQYHIFADGIDWTKHVNVIVRLHGDGSGTYVHEFDGYKRSGMLSDFAREARAKNAIVIAPKSPDRIGHTTWWENFEKNDEWLTSLIETELLSHPAIEKDRFYWMGYSGGSEFLSYHYIPKHPDMVKGGSLMCAGGGASIYNERLIKNSTTDRGVPLAWHVGHLDDGTTSIDGFDAVSASKRGHDAYKRHGFTNVERVVIQGKDHYNIDQRAMFNDTLMGWLK